MLSDLNFHLRQAVQLNLSELFSTDDLQVKVDQGFIKVEEAQANVNYLVGKIYLQLNSGILLTKQNMKLQTGQFKLPVSLLTKVDGAISNTETATVQYSLDKRVKNMWNMVVGTQFQLNKHWMIRAEYGFLGSRSQFVGGLQYRFGL